MGQKKQMADKKNLPRKAGAYGAVLGADKDVPTQQAPLPDASPCHPRDSAGVGADVGGKAGLSAAAWGDPGSGTGSALPVNRVCNFTRKTLSN